MKREIIDNQVLLNDVKQTCLDCNGIYKVSGLIQYCECTTFYHGHSKWRINEFTLPNFKWIKTKDGYRGSYA